MAVSLGSPDMKAYSDFDIILYGDIDLPLPGLLPRLGSFQRRKAQSPLLVYQVGECRSRGAPQ